MVRIIEGFWEEVAKEARLNGRRVRVEIEEGKGTITFSETPAAPALSPDRWLQHLVDFSNSHISPQNEIDLNRDHLFEELHG